MLKFISSTALVFSITLSAQTTDDVTAALRHKDQLLLDAIATGERAIWEGTLASEFLYADENNRVISRSDFLKELTPLPAGVSGNIAITSYEMHGVGDTVIVVHRDDETEHYFGSELHAQYLMTETWQLLGGEWKLRAIHCAAVPVDAQTIVLTQAQMDELVGTYVAGTLTYVVSRNGDHLLGAQTGQKEILLKAETRDVLIAAGQPRSRKVFQRDGTGKVVSLSDRRENRDLTWTKRQ